MGDEQERDPITFAAYDLGQKAGLIGREIKGQEDDEVSSYEYAVKSRDAMAAAVTRNECHRVAHHAHVEIAGILYTYLDQVDTGADLLSRAPLYYPVSRCDLRFKYLILCDTLCCGQ